MRYTVPYLVECYYIIEPCHFSRELLVVSVDPFLFCALVINELIDSPLKTLNFSEKITYLEQIEFTIFGNFAKLFLVCLFVRNSGFSRDRSIKRMFHQSRNAEPGASRPDDPSSKYTKSC